MFLNIYILAMHRLLLSEDNHLKEEDRFILICPLKNTCSVKRKKKKIRSKRQNQTLSEENIFNSKENSSFKLAFTVQFC